MLSDIRVTGEYKLNTLYSVSSLLIYISMKHKIKIEK